jgi:hypothetical protein
VGSELIKVIDTQSSYPMRAPRVAEFTDAGPGVGVTNKMVPLRDAEIARICNSDIRIRVHRCPGDPCEAERLNGAISDATCDGGTHIFEHYKKFADLTKEVRH